jgi:redox-sensing transcriptional repressor
MNKDLILRLSKYKRLLYKLKALGLERVFSNNLGDAIGVAPALVRKDFSLLNLTGNKRGGYEIEMLITHLDKLLGRDKPKNVVVVGCGRIGQALMRYDDFNREGLQIVAGFDIKPEQARENVKVPIYHVDELSDFVKKNKIRVGIITVPDSAATEVLDLLISSGVRGILNFSSVELRCTVHTCGEVECPKLCVIHNVNIGLELEHIFYQINIIEQEAREQKEKEQQ